MLPTNDDACSVGSALDLTDSPTLSNATTVREGSITPDHCKEQGDRSSSPDLIWQPEHPGCRPSRPRTKTDKNGKQDKKGSNHAPFSSVDYTRLLLTTHSPSERPTSTPAPIKPLAHKSLTRPSMLISENTSPNSESPPLTPLGNNFFRRSKSFSERPQEEVASAIRAAKAQFKAPDQAAVPLTAQAAIFRRVILRSPSTPADITLSKEGANIQLKPMTPTTMTRVPGLPLSPTSKMKAPSPHSSSPTLSKPLTFWYQGLFKDVSPPMTPSGTPPFKPNL